MHTRNDCAATLCKEHVVNGSIKQVLTGSSIRLLLRYFKTLKEKMKFAEVICLVVVSS